MEKLFEIPELFTLSGRKVTGDMSFEDLVLAGGGNTCSGGSGAAEEGGGN